MFNRWRHPAALALTVGIGFPALAAAATGSPPPGLEAKPQVRLHGKPRVLVRAVKRLKETMDAQLDQPRNGNSGGGQTYTLPGGVSQATLDAIGVCESGGDPTSVSADGTYRGKYQFDYGTWASVGGHGDPAAASEAEQDYRAGLLYVRSGSSPWPNCA